MTVNSVKFNLDIAQINVTFDNAPLNVFFLRTGINQSILIRIIKYCKINNCKYFKQIKLKFIFFYFQSLFILNTDQELLYLLQIIKQSPNYHSTTHKNNHPIIQSQIYIINYEIKDYKINSLLIIFFYIIKPLIVTYDFSYI
ncbi:hypothetical protein pb186bvf_007952 [Paramecium bursaria]